MFKRSLNALIISTVFVLNCLSTGCIKHVNHDLTIIEAKRSYAEGNHTRAFHLSEILAHQGDGDAQYAVGYMHYYGVGVPKNTTLGVAWIKKSEENGNECAYAALQLLAECRAPSLPYCDEDCG